MGRGAQPPPRKAERPQLMALLAGPGEGARPGRVGAEVEEQSGVPGGVSVGERGSPRLPRHPVSPQLGVGSRGAAAGADLGQVLRGAALEPGGGAAPRQQGADGGGCPLGVPWALRAPLVGPPWAHSRPRSCGGRRCVGSCRMSAGSTSGSCSSTGRPSTWSGCESGAGGGVSAHRTAFGWE